MSVYTKGQLVWAKIKGYPWWPAVVQIVPKPNQDKNDLDEKEVLVNFIGENSHAVLTYDKVADFTAKFKQHSASKNKKLQESIRVAQRILAGESTYEEEREKLLASIKQSLEAQEAGETKRTTRGRPSTKKKAEMGSEDAFKEKEAVQKTKEITAKVKEAVQKEKEKEKGPLYNFKEDVLGLQKKPDTEKAHPTKEKEAIPKEKEVAPKEKEAVPKEKEVAPKEKASPKSKQTKDSRLTQKQKAKEKEKEKKRDHTEELQDFLPFRLTRSQVRREPSEPRVELEPKTKKRGGSRATKKDTATDNKHTKDSKENASKPKPKGRLLLDEDDDMNHTVPSRVEEKPDEEEHMASPAKVSERKFSGLRTDFEEEKNPHGQAETSVSRASEGNRMDLDMPNDPAVGSLRALDVQSSVTADSLPSTNLNSKRSNSAILKDASPIYTTQAKSTGIMGEAEYNEYITKKAKINMVEEEKELDERVLGTEVYNMLLIKKFEASLSKILDRVSNKLQGTERLKEYDVDMIKVLEIIEEFESRNFNGSEFIGSDLGKILKTMHFLLVKHKTRIPKTGELVITALAKILHKIKDKILKYCLDNTEYMDALKLQQEIKPTIMTAIDIDFEEIKAKIEDEAKVEAAPIATKIEEESTSAYSQVQKQASAGTTATTTTTATTAATAANTTAAPATVTTGSATTATAATETTAAKPAPVQQATAAPVNNTAVATVAAVTQPVASGAKEVPKELVKENSSVNKNNETGNPNDITLFLRKKICQKLARLLQRSYHMDKEKSQEMTLRVEDKLNRFYLGNANEYKLAIKGLHKLIKAQNLSAEDLAQVLDMSLEQFKQMLKEKLPEIADGQAHDMNDNDLTPHNDTSDLVRREPVLMNEDPSTFDFNALLAAKMDTDMALNMAKKEGEEAKEKMVVEEANSFIQDLLETKEAKQ